MSALLPIRLPAAPEQAAREELIARLLEMTEALADGNDRLFGERLQKLLSRREQGLFLRIEQLTETLQQAFAALQSDQRWEGITRDLPDTGTRLDHVTRLTEAATHRTLDLVEQSQAELTDLALLTGEIGRARATLLNAAVPPSLYAVEQRLQHIEEALRQGHAQLRTRLSELAQAQEYQDLSGQLLKRAGRVVRDVEASLADLLKNRLPTQVAAVSADTTLEGPAVPGVGQVRADQADADALLALFM